MAGINAYTVLCLHCNGADASTTFTDNSPLHNTVTAVDDAQLDTAEKKFGSAAGLFDGTDDCLTIPAFSAIHFGSNNFTMDTWVYQDEAMGTSRTLAGLGGGVENWSDAAGIEWGWYTSTDSKLYFVYRQSSTFHVVASTNVIAIASGWHHLEVDRYGSTITLRVDGTSVGSASISGAIDSVTGGTPLLVIGGSRALTSTWKGWKDEFRIQSGEAYWTADFTPPTEEYNSDLSFTDGVSVSGAFVLSSPLSISEGVEVNDTFGLSESKSLTEGVEIADVFALSETKSLTEAIEVSDAYSVSFNQRSLTEAVVVGDGWNINSLNSVRRHRRRIA